MKKTILFLLTVIVTQSVFSQNLTVSIDAPLPVCNSGDCTSLQANYSLTQPTNTYTVASIPYNPLFISTGGTLITSTNADDIWSDVAFTLPFNFCFYGQNYNSILIGSNGVVHFPNGTHSAGGFCPWSFSATIPNAAFPIKNAIYGVYQDTDIRTPPVTNGAIQNVNYYIAGTAPNRVFVANFNQLPQFSCGAGVGLQTTQVILYETTNVIDVLVKNRTSCTSWNSGSGVIGVQNSAGTQAVVPTGRNTGTWSATNEAWRFTPAQAGPTNTTLSWLANGVPIAASTNVNPLTVCPTVATTYTAQVDYLQCDGTNKTITDNVVVGPEAPLPTLNPQNIVQCTSASGPYTFNINQNTYMLNGAPAGDYVFYYYVDNAGVPGTQIPNGSLTSYTPVSTTYPQTIWVLVEDQNTTGCTNLRSFTLNVVAAPGGSFSYASPFCDSVTSAQAPILSALTSGGQYTASPAGLIIDSNTGAITPSGSTPGTYTVNYNILATGSCPAYSAPPVSVTISVSPATPIIATTAATCLADGSSTITNYNAAYTYIFTPAGPSVGAGGIISGMVTGTSYTVTATNGSCTSVASVPFNNPVMLPTPLVPTIIATAPTCSANGSSTVSNYNAAETYVFTPAGPSVGAGGAISGMTIGTNYTVTAGNGSCTSTASAPFSNSPIATVPAVPTIATSAATCLADGSSTITNYNATQGYTFTPSGPSVGAGGIISAMIAGTSYTVVASNGSCTSVASIPFNNPVMLTTPSVPTITSVPPTCSANGTSTVSNYNATQTYVFTPAGPSVGSGGAISGMTIGTNYTVTAGNGSCTSVASAPFSNSPIATVPAVPTIATSAATCLADGSSTITNYNATETYTFTPAGPSVGAGGVISGMIAGTSYTVTSANGSCTSVASTPFNNPVMLTTPSVPTITSVPPTCSANGTSTVSNYNATQTYVFTPAGPSVGAGGAISGMTIGTNYTVTAGNGSCTSVASAPFSNAAMLVVPVVPTIATTTATCLADGSSTITNYNAAQTYTFTPAGPSVGAGGIISGMVTGTSYTVTSANASCTSAASTPFNNPVMLTTPSVPTITSVPPTCSANGTSTVSNYNATQTYVFTPAGPSVGTGGVISGMTIGTNYTVTAGNGSCTSTASAPFSNAAMLVVPVVPTIATTTSTCLADGSSTITNYNAAQTYTFTPAGPSVGAGGIISGMISGTSYTVTSANGSCTSAASTPFNNPVMLTTPSVPTITSVPPTCSANGTSTVSNYNATQTYVFSPAGPSVGAGGVISGMTIGTNYTVTAGNGSCTSTASAPFSNAAMLVVPVVPTIATTTATCLADGSSTITNYNAAQTYTFTPAGPSVGAGGIISGMIAGTSYTVTSANGSCTSAASTPFNNPVMLTTPSVPTITSVPPTCSANGTSTVSNYNSTQTYVFTPAGPSVGAGGVISGMTIGTNYTVTAGNGSCISSSSVPFWNDVMLTTPTLVITNPTAVCSPSTVDITLPVVTAGSTGGGALNYWTDAAGSIALTNPSAIASSGTYYISSSLGSCRDIKPVSVVINQIPVINLNGGYICVDAVSGASLSSFTIDSQLSATNYTFDWTDSIGNTVGTQSSYIATVPGTYYLVATTTAFPFCQTIKTPVTIFPSSSPSGISFVTSNYFSDTLSFQVNATPAGNYEYQIDGGQFQTSNIFTNVTPGTHSVGVRDIHNVCNPTIGEVTVVDYPRYFTPNGDGVHETWNIPFLSSQLNSKIEIFDRFGKLLKVIQPSGNGWDGTYLNQDLPSTDYWFVVYYEEDGVSKSHKAHFAMKR